LFRISQQGRTKIGELARQTKMQPRG